jgi:hypothetical protein
MRPPHWLDGVILRVHCSTENVKNRRIKTSFVSNWRSGKE